MCIRDRYEGTDIDVEYEIAKKKKEIGRIVSFEDEIHKYIKLDYVVAKSISFRKGTPRIFEYKITSEPITKAVKLQSEIDGLINIVLTDKKRIHSQEVLNHQHPILYCFVQKNENITESLTDISVVDRILIDNTLDKVARAELVEYKDSLIREFKEYFQNQLFSLGSKWFIIGQKKSFTTERELNKSLSSFANHLYDKTPIFKNELINRSKISGSIHYAKRLFISALIENWNKVNLGFDNKKFPAERMIYQSLLKQTGIHQNDELLNSASFDRPSDKSFIPLWIHCEQFINDSRSGKRTVSELIESLRQQPFKLKDGLIEFWMISFLFIKRDEYAMYMDGVYLPNFTTELAELLFKKPESFVIKGIEVDGVRLSLFNKYRTLVNKDITTDIKDKGFQEIAKPFLVFYKQLSHYAKQSTNGLSDNTIKLRETLLNAKELEKTFFEDLPKCFGYSIQDLDKDEVVLNTFASALQDSIRELRMLDTVLAERYFDFVNNYITEEKLSFDKLRSLLKERYPLDIVKLLNTSQKSVVRRIHSEIPEESLWISSLCQAIMAKPLNKLNDDEAEVLLKRTAEVFKALDGFAELTKLNVDSDKELALRFEILASDSSNTSSQTVVLKKGQLKEIQKLEIEIEEILKGKDSDIRKGLLLKMLKDM